MIVKRNGEKYQEKKKGGGTLSVDRLGTTGWSEEDLQEKHYQYAQASGFSK